MPDPAAYMTVQTAAAFLAIEDETVLDRIHSGELVAVDISARPGKTRPRWRISPKALDDFLARRTAKPAPAPVSAPRPVRRRRDPAVREYF